MNITEEQYVTTLLEKLKAIKRNLESYKNDLDELLHAKVKVSARNALRFSDIVRSLKAIRDDIDSFITSLETRIDCVEIIWKEGKVITTKNFASAREEK